MWALVNEGTVLSEGTKATLKRFTNASDTFPAKPQRPGGFFEQSEVQFPNRFPPVKTEEVLKEAYERVKGQRSNLSQEFSPQAVGFIAKQDLTMESKRNLLNNFPSQ